MENIENYTIELLRALRNDLASLKSDMHHGFAGTELRLSAIEDMLQADFTSRLAQRDQIKNLAERLERVEKQLASRL